MVGMAINFPMMGSVKSYHSIVSYILKDLDREALFLLDSIKLEEVYFALCSISNQLL
jgi:hypothetical protein